MCLPLYTCSSTAFLLAFSAIPSNRRSTVGFVVKGWIKSVRAARVDVLATRNVMLTVGMRWYMTVIEKREV